VAINTEKMSSSNLMIILLLINLLVVGVAGLAIKSLYGTIALDTKIEHSKSVAAKQADEDVDAAPGLINSYAALGDKSPELASALPNTADFPSLIVTLENMGNASGLKIKSIAPTLVTGSVDPVAGAAAPAAPDPSAPPKPQQYTFSLTTATTYDSVLKFLNTIETSARPMRVMNVQFTGSGSNLNSQIDLMTYYQDKAELPFSTENVK
jgi:hypothetical protein